MRTLTTFLLAVSLLGCNAEQITAPAQQPAAIRTGGCTVHFKYWMDRADHSKGSLTHSYTYANTDDCPDSLWVSWDMDKKP